MFNVKYESSSEEDQQEKDLLTDENQIHLVRDSESELDSDEEEEKLEQQMSEDDHITNIIMNESSQEEHIKMQQLKLKQKSLSHKKGIKSRTSHASSLVGKDQPEIEEIVKMFTHDLQQSIRQRFKNKSQLTKSQKKIPFEIQKILGEANNLYAFKQFTEAIKLLEQVIMRMPELSEAYSTIASIYDEMGNYDMSLNFGIMASFLIKTDVERWKTCANQAKYLRRYKQAIYCYNRAIKQTSQQNKEEILRMRFEKLTIYKISGDYSSAVRALEKLIKQNKNDKDRVFQLKIALAQTLSEQGFAQRSFEVLEEQIKQNDLSDTQKIDLILILCDIALAKKEFQYLTNFLEQQDQQNILNILKEKDMYKVKIFQLNIKQLMCLINLDDKFNCQYIIDNSQKLKEEKYLEFIDNYQRVAGSMMSLGDALEQKEENIEQALSVYKSFLKICIPIDQANIFFKIGQLYFKVQQYDQAKNNFEEAFYKCPIQQNFQIRIALNEVYQKLGDQQKALDILYNAFPIQKQNLTPENQLNQHKQQLPRKRKRTKQHDDQIIVTSDSDDNKKQQYTIQDSQHLYDQILNQQYNNQEEEKSVSSSDDYSVNSETQSIMRQSGNITPNFMNYKRTPNQLQFYNNDQKDKDYLTKMSKRLQKRRRKLMLEEVNQHDIDDIRKQLQDFEIQNNLLSLEKAKIHLQINQIDEFLHIFYPSLIDSLQNLKLKQRLQVILYNQALKNAGSQNNEQFFVKPNQNIDSQKSVIRVSTSAKNYIFDELEQYKTILNHEKPQDLADIILATLKHLILKSQIDQAEKIIQLIEDIEVIQTNIYQNQSLFQLYQKYATLIYYENGKFNKAYKALRKISNETTYQNWAVIGCILNNHNDPTFCRSYMKRLFNKSQSINPFIVMILGNCYNQKQQCDLALSNYWVLTKNLFNDEIRDRNGLLSLILAIVNLVQGYQRTNNEKELSIKRAFSFFIQYIEQRDDKIEVYYNIGRLFHLMGLNTLSLEYYEKVIKETSNIELINENLRDTRIRSIFNLAQILKGSGINSGISLPEGEKQELSKVNCLRKAHELITSMIEI